jgi:anti-anti-sigma factor
MLVVHERRTSNPPATEPLHRSVIGVGRACLTAFDSSWVTVVALSGEIDALNAEPVASYLHEFASGDRALVLDFSGVGFLGVDGLEGLFALGETCDRLGVDWALVTSHSVRRLLRAGDRERRLPAVGSMVEVLQRFRTARRRRGQLRVVD